MWSLGLVPYWGNSLWEITTCFIIHTGLFFSHSLYSAVPTAYIRLSNALGNEGRKRSGAWVPLCRPEEPQDPSIHHVSNAFPGAVTACDKAHEIRVAPQLIMKPVLCLM
jgi:hypothetical protein